MKKLVILLFCVFSALPFATAQEMQTLFRSSRPSGGYVALSNKFTTIKGQYANIAEIYGGWLIHGRFLLGIGVAASTNNLEVPTQYSTSPLRPMSWQYGQVGMMNEYIFWSNKLVHVNLSLFSGGAFTVQYERRDEDLEYDENFFPVVEPGVQLELNVFKWLRISPGVSYRKTFGSDAIGLRDADLSDWSYNMTLKIGKF
jgi:hypothetical protein